MNLVFPVLDGPLDGLGDRVTPIEDPVAGPAGQD